MTVAELIKALSAYDPGLPVLVPGTGMRKDFDVDVTQVRAGTFSPLDDRGCRAERDSLDDPEEPREQAVRLG